MTTRRILDVANYQGVPDFAALKRADPTLAGVIIKATEGQWKFTNPDMDAQYRAARAAGLAVGFYTFWHPGFAGTADAQLFLDRIAGYDAELGIWLDAEVSDGVPASQMLGRLLEDLHLMASKYPMKTGIYSAGWWWNPNTIGSAAAHMEAWPLWVAGYTANLPVLPVPWTSAILWQYTDHYAGLNMDASVFLGSDTQWNWLVGGKPSPQPANDFAAKTRGVQAAVHGVIDGIFGHDTDTRCEGIKAMGVPANRNNPDKVKYAQQVMAFDGPHTDGKWGPITASHWTATVKAIQTAMGVPASGGWDANTNFAYAVLDPFR